MTSGDAYFDSCDKQNLGLESILKLLTVYDCNGNPALKTLDQCASGSGGGFPASVTRTAFFDRVTDSGTLASGTYMSVSIANSGSANGTLLGKTLKPGEVVEWGINLLDKIGAITYDATGTEFIINGIQF